MKHLIIILFTLCGLSLQSQTIVKMAVPTQAKDPVKVVVLFDEAVPEGIPLVLGLMGYDVIGGIKPYTFEWLQNGKQIGTNDIVVITPAKGDQITLKATDKNRCFSVTSFNMKVIANTPKELNDKENSVGVYPTIIKNDEINIFLPSAIENTQALVRIIDMNGRFLYRSFISGSTSIKYQLADGNYFVSIKIADINKVERIIVQH